MQRHGPKPVLMTLMLFWLWMSPMSSSDLQNWIPDPVYLIILSVLQSSFKHISKEQQSSWLFFFQIISYLKLPSLPYVSLGAYGCRCYSHDIGVCEWAYNSFNFTLLSGYEIIWQLTAKLIVIPHSWLTKKSWEAKFNKPYSTQLSAFMCR